MKLPHVAMAFALIVALVVMPGCASLPDDQDPTQLASTPTSSVSTPPSKDELYAQAKVVYAGIHAQQMKLQYAGGAAELPPAFLELVTGQLATDYAAIYRKWKEDGTVSLGPDPQVVWARPHDKNFEQSVVSLGVCTDGSQTRVQQGNGSVALGRPAINYFYFKYFDGVLKAFAADDERVDKC